MTDKVFSIRIPEELYNAIQAKAQADDTSMTKVAISALTSGLGISSTDDRLSQLEQQVAEMGDRLGKLRVA